MSSTPTPSESLHARIEALPPDERAIIDSLLTRIELGRRQYGPWVIDDGRDYPSETFAELIDGLHYCAAELVRQQRRERQRRRRVYVCHPYSADPVGNAKKVGELCRQLIAEGVLPIAPQLYLPAFIDETTERELALELCQELVDLADEVSVFDTQLTSGMGRELDRAKWRQIPIKNRKRVQP